MILHLVRHGSTETSGQTYAGRRDVALTGEGLAQAEAVAAALASRPVAVILASPLSRARLTGQPLAERLGLPLLEEQALIEFDFGAYDGRSKAEVSLRLRKAHLTTPVPGGESLADVWDRAGAVLARISAELARSAGEEAVAVGHFWINRLIHGRCMGLPFEAACRDRGYRPATGEIRTVALPPRAGCDT